MDEKEVVSLIIDVAKEVGEQDEIDLPVDLDRNSPLFGSDGVLDSVGLVSLVIAVEQALEERHGRSISLADNKALSAQRSPFRSIGSLADYIVANLLPCNEYQSPS